MASLAEDPDLQGKVLTSEVLTSIINLLGNPGLEADAVKAACRAMAALCVSDEMVSAVVDLGGLSALVESIRRHRRADACCKAGMQVIYILSTYDGAGGCKWRQDRPERPQ